MAITFVCECGKTLRAGDDLAGRKTRCPECSSILTIPEPEVDPDPIPPEPEPSDSPYDLEYSPKPFSASDCVSASASPTARRLVISACQL